MIVNSALMRPALPAKKPLLGICSSKDSNKFKAQLQNDLFSSQKPKQFFAINFKSRSEQTQKTVDYIRNLKEQGKVESIYDLKPEKIEHILDGIEVFEGIDVKDLYVLPGVVDILTQRGCSNNCLHCFIKARPQMASIKWEDFSRFTEGVKELKSRLGFNVFEINREKYDSKRRDYTFSQGVYPYLDADPLELLSLDKNGKKYNIKDFVQKFYNDTEVPLKVKTAGWDIANAESQKAGEDLTKLLCTEEYKNALPEVIVSIHPFHKIMTAANKAKKSGKIAEYEKFRQKYVERMSNTLKTFLPLAKKDKLLINAQYALGGLAGSGYTEEDSKNLCKDILAHLEGDCAEAGIDCDFLTAEKDIEKNPYFEPMNPILSVARDKKGFLNEGSPLTFIFEKSSEGNSRIVVEPFDIKHAFGNEVSENIVNNIRNQPDFIDELVINIDPVNNLDLILADKNKLAKDRAKMFMGSLLYTLDRFKKVDPNKLVIRLNYSEDDKFSKAKLENILKHVEAKTGKKFENVEYTQISKENFQQKLAENKDAFLNLLQNLNPEGRVRFISQLRKGINVDGQVYLPDINTRAFGEEKFENRAIILEGLKFNFLYPQKYIHDANLAGSSIKYDKNQITALCKEN